jgi:hypothetical protein
MRVKFLRPLNQPNPDWKGEEHEAAAKRHLLITPDGYLRLSEDGKQAERVHRWIERPVGYEHERHDAYLLCIHSEALPVDDEAKQICAHLGLTDAVIEAAHMRKVQFENTPFDPDTGKPIEDDSDE